MNRDIRLSVNFWEHRKTIRLHRMYGAEAIIALIRLWCWTGKFAPEGVLTGMDEADIESAAGWTGGHGDLVNALVTIGWLDTDPYRLHDWAERQPWVVGSKERSEAARVAGKASAEARKAKYGSAEPRTDHERGVRNLRTAHERPHERITNPRTPSPSPSLLEIGDAKASPCREVSGNGTGKVPYDQVIAYLNEQTGKQFKATNKETRAHISARWNEGFRLEDFKAVVDIKCAAWLKDAKMSQFLRPATLFGTKFESYLNERAKGPAKTVPKDDPYAHLYEFTECGDS